MLVLMLHAMRGIRISTPLVERGQVFGDYLQTSNIFIVFFLRLTVSCL